ncbi:MAG TPA: BTAD domain-containing putative transcriptional regulator [Gaiellaceae bacterium]|nr:BTAD domain-containing putative transcriptional regulator [Gaiellaceae bacterium]
MEVRLLGPLEVDAGDGGVPLPRAKQRALLAVLALHAGEAVPVDRLVDDLWGERPPARAVGSLHNLVSQLRRLLGAGAIVTRGRGYALACAPDDVDAHRFELVVEQARGADPSTRAHRLREALALWRGPALADLALEPFAAVEAARLDEERTAAREALLEAELELGKGPELVAELERLVAEHPLRERLRGQLMHALYRAGRQADALDAYRAARTVLVEELGLEPSPELQELHAAILRQDPSLSAAAVAGTRAAPRVDERRKTVTALFVDLVDSTSLATGLDPEVLRILMDRYFEAARTAVERHGGVVEKYIGDAVAAIFGEPVLHEDDALRAVRAAFDLHAALAAIATDLERSHGVELRARAGVATGTVLVGERRVDESRTVGGAMTVAARLEAAAAVGETLIAQETLELVRAHVRFERVPEVALGQSATLPAFRVRELRPGADTFRPTPLIDRQAELEQLRAAYADACEAGRGKAVTVIGEAGAGKSRLVRELVLAVEHEAQVLVGRCASYGDGATWVPLEEALAPVLADRRGSAFLGAEPQSERLRAALAPVGGDEAHAVPVGETFWAVRRLLERAAAERPVVLVLDDVHWAEGTLLDLVEYLRARPPAAPVLVSCAARPDLLERRPGWRDEGCVALGDLAERDAEALVALLGAEHVDPSEQRRILDVGGGNPLFLEQLLAHALERGSGGGRPVPPTVEAVLASRLESLERAERRVLECAAVVGREFTRAAILGLHDEDDELGADAALMAALRRGLVRVAPDAADEDAYRFHHALVRDVAYAAIPMLRRASLHERVAAFLTKRGRVPEEVVGLHLETAHGLRRKLGERGPPLEELGRRAAELLGGAGIRAWQRADASTARNLLGRAAALLPEDDAWGIELRCELGTAERVAGRLAEAEATLARAAEDARRSGVRRLELRAELELGALRLATSPVPDVDAQVARAQAAIPELERAGDDRGLGRAQLLAGYAAGAFRLQNAAWLEGAERAAIHYRRAGWPAAWAAAGIANALFHGPTPVPEAIARCRSLLVADDVGRSGAAHVTFVLGGLEAMRGRFDTGRSLVAEATLALDELGLAARLADAVACRAWVELLAGDLPAAEAALRASAESVRAAGDVGSALTRGVELADVCYRLGRLDEAGALAGEAEARGSADDIALQFTWRMVRAKLLAAGGEVDAAVGLAAEAVALAARTDALNQHGQTEATLAEVLVAAGRPGEARDAARRAAALFRRKGNRVLERALREQFDMEPPATTPRRS